MSVAPAPAWTLVIPTRWGATRLPGKPLADLGGRPVVAHVVERARASGAARVVLATDDARIARAVDGQVEVCMTDPGHGSGSERVAEVVRRLGLPADALVVNLQGDEPFMPPALLDQVAALLAGDDAELATLCVPVRAMAEVFDPAVVKVVMDEGGHALWFSRAPMPWWREGFAPGGSDGAAPPEGLGVWHRHLGLYAYRAGALARLVAAPASPAERLESLEQLRALHLGMRIRIAVAAATPGPGIDTPADLAHARALMAAAD